MSNNCKVFIYLAPKLRYLRVLLILFFIKEVEQPHIGAYTKNQHQNHLQLFS
jgi:hypothetical protein